jgi:hypothetical protein
MPSDRPEPQTLKDFSQALLPAALEGAAEQLTRNALVHLIIEERANGKSGPTNHAAHDG